MGIYSLTVREALENSFGLILAKILEFGYLVFTAVVYSLFHVCLVKMHFKLNRGYM